MSTLIQKIQVKRGTNTARSSITPDMGELIYTTDTKRLYIGDGATVGGIEVGSSDNIGSLETKVNSLESILRSNDVNLDSLQEVVSFVKNNKSDLEALKSISVINNLTSTSTTNPLSANQGKVLGTEINNLRDQGMILGDRINNLGDQDIELDGKITDLVNSKQDNITGIEGGSF